MFHCGIESMNGDRALYKLLDKVLSRKLMVNYSWAGIIKKGNPEKKAFKRFRNTCQFLFGMCQKADPKFGWHAFEAMMKTRILPHAIRRNKDENEIRRESAPKMRKVWTSPKSNRCIIDIPVDKNDATNSHCKQYKFVKGMI